MVKLHDNRAVDDDEEEEQMEEEEEENQQEKEYHPKAATKNLNKESIPEEIPQQKQSKLERIKPTSTIDPNLELV